MEPRNILRFNRDNSSMDCSQNFSSLSINKISACPEQENELEKRGFSQNNHNRNFSPHLPQFSGSQRLVGLQETSQGSQSRLGPQSPHRNSAIGSNPIHFSDLHGEPNQQVALQDLNQRVVPVRLPRSESPNSKICLTSNNALFQRRMNPVTSFFPVHPVHPSFSEVVLKRRKPVKMATNQTSDTNGFEIQGSSTHQLGRSAEVTANETLSTNGFTVQERSTHKLSRQAAIGNNDILSAKSFTVHGSTTNQLVRQANNTLSANGFAVHGSSTRLLGRSAEVVANETLSRNGFAIRGSSIHQLGRSAEVTANETLSTNGFTVHGNTTHQLGRSAEVVANKNLSRNDFAVNGNTTHQLVRQAKGTLSANGFTVPRSLRHQLSKLAERVANSFLVQGNYMQNAGCDLNYLVTSVYKGWLLLRRNIDAKKVQNEVPISPTEPGKPPCILISGPRGADKRDLLLNFLSKHVKNIPKKHDFCEGFRTPIKVNGKKVSIDFMILKSMDEAEEMIDMENSEKQCVLMFVYNLNLFGAIQEIEKYIEGNRKYYTKSKVPILLVANMDFKTSAKRTKNKAAKKREQQTNATDDAIMQGFNVYSKYTEVVAYCRCETKFRDNVDEIFYLAINLAMKGKCIPYMDSARNQKIG